MPTLNRRFRPAAVAALLVFASVLSCGREITGPRAAGRLAQVALNPVFGEIRLGGTGEVKSIGSVVDFTSVRVVLLRTNGDTAVDQMVVFPLNSDSVRLALNVTLSEAATRDGETFAATLKYINAAGDTVFSGGPAAVTATLPGSPPSEDSPIPILYSGRGANAALLVMSPTGFTGTIGQTVAFSAVVSDSAQAPITAVPVAYTSTDSARVSVNLRTGVATLLGARGSALVIAQTLTGQADTAPVVITPTASAIALVSGGNQQVRQGQAFPLPIRVQVNAADNVGLAGVPVAFTVTRGQGAPNPAVDTTDASGFAEAIWIAGDSAGAAVLRASVVGLPIEVTIGGTQLSSAPTSLAFTAQPSNFTAGDTIPPFNVLVLDATGDTVSGFVGNVSLDLTGGTAGAALVGTSVVAAVNGVGQFTGLTVNRGGTAFRIRATVAGVPPVQSNTFNVTAAPPRFITVVGGANQTAPALTVLPDSVRVRVTNTFGAPVGGVTVNWALALGGGSVAPATSVTDSTGRAAAQWTIGASGTQQITAGVTGLQPVPISASVFVPQGQPTLFVGLEFLSTTIFGARSVPVFISPAPATAIVATLVTRDTTIVKWTTDSTIFTAGSTLRSPTLVGRATGSTYAVVISSAGTDSLLVAVDSASVSISGYTTSAAAGDTLRKVIYLSEPAPPGGVIVTVVSSDRDAMLVAPGSGRGRPADECEYYCYGLRAADEPFRILAVPAETAFVSIPAGQLAGQVVLFPLDADGVNATVSVSAPGYSSGSAFYDIEALRFTFYPNYTAFGVPFAVGERNAFSAYFNRAVANDRTVRVTSRNPSAVRVDSIGTILAQNSVLGSQAYEGLSIDSTYIVVESSGIPADSFFVRVGPAYLNSDLGAITAPVGSRVSLNLFTAASALVFNPYSQPPRASDLALTLTSSDPTVFVPDFASVVLPRGEVYVAATIRALGVGTARLFVTAPGTVTDTIDVTVTAATLSVFDSFFRVGSGQVHRTLYTSVSSASYQTTGTVLVNIASSDPTILNVITPQLTVRTDGYSDNAVLLGGTPGSVTLTFSAPGFTSVLRTFTVSAPALVMSTFGSPQTINADSAAGSIFVSTSDGSNVTRPPADRVDARLRSTNSAVLLVTDSLVTIGVNSNGSVFGGTYRSIAPGTARLVIAAPGYTPDTSAIVTVRPYRLDVPSGVFTMGQGTEFQFGVFRQAPQGGVTPFTVTARGPAGVTLRAPADSFPLGGNFRTVTVRARAGTGTDTLFLQAPGMVSDTVRVNVLPSRVTPIASYGLLVGQDLEVSAAVRPLGSSISYPVADSVTLVIQVIDTAMIALIDDTVRIAAGEQQPYQTGLVRFRRPGAGKVRLVDPSGRFAADSAQLFAYPQSLSGSQEKIFLTMGQAESGGYYVYRDFSFADSIWIRFTSSAPSLVPAPDSVLIRSSDSYAFFSLAAGDTVGSARLTASSPGYLSQEFDVFVTRGAVEMYAYSTVAVGSRTRADVYPINSVSRENVPMNAALQLRMRSMDPTIAAIGADSVFTIPAGDYFIGPDGVGPVIGVGFGRTEIVLDDPRTGSFQQLVPSRMLFDVASATLRASTKVLSATVGLTSYAYSYYVTPTTGVDSVWIRLRSVGGKVAFSADSVLASAYSNYGYFGLTGLSAGLDTVVFTAPGFPPDTVLADVGAGRLIVSGSNPPALMAVGDSALVTLNFAGADGGSATLADASRTLSFDGPAGIQILDPVTRVPITSIVVPNGAYGVSFWVRAIGTTGGTVSVAGPGLIQYQRVFNTFIRP